MQSPDPVHEHDIFGYSPPPVLLCIVGVFERQKPHVPPTTLTTNGTDGRIVASDSLNTQKVKDRLCISKGVPLDEIQNEVSSSMLVERLGRVRANV